jgi:hypothetical protein
MSERPYVQHIMVGTSAALLRRADEHSRYVTKLIDRATLIAVCLELPGDMPARVLLQPGVFGFEC